MSESENNKGNQEDGKEENNEEGEELDNNGEEEGEEVEGEDDHEGNEGDGENIENEKKNGNGNGVSNNSRSKVENQDPKAKDKDKSKDYEVEITKLKEEKEKYESKLKQMKEMVTEIKEKYEYEINKRTEIKDKIIFQLTTKIEGLEKKVQDFEGKIKDNRISEERVKLYKKKYELHIQERIELEDFIMKQEEKINELSSKFKLVEETLRRKKDETKKSESNCNTLIKIIEDQKKLINSLSSTSKALQNEEQSKKLIQEKDNELNYFKNFIQSLKTENSLKNESIGSLKKGLSKLKEESRILKIVIRSINLSQDQIDKINSLNPDLASVISKLLALITKENTTKDELNASQSERTKLMPDKFKNDVSPVKIVGGGGNLGSKIKSNQNSISLYVDDNIGATDESVKEITTLMKKIIDEA